MTFVPPLPETHSWCLCAGGIGDSFAPDPYTDTIGMPSDHTEAPSDGMLTCLINDAISADHMGLAFQVETTGKCPCVHTKTIWQVSCYSFLRKVV